MGKGGLGVIGEHNHVIQAELVLLGHCIACIEIIFQLRVCDPQLPTLLLSSISCFACLKGF